MGSTVFPVPSSGAGLPAGATEKVASGFVKNGYASISGSFPAGKYLVVSDTACNVNFTTAMDVNGYQNAIFSKGGSCVVDVPVSSAVIEYNAMPTAEDYIYELSVSGGNSATTILAATNRLSTANSQSFPRSYSAFPYKGKLISLGSTGVIWKSTDWETATNTGLNSGISSAGAFTYMVGTDGTTWRGMGGGATTAWYTTNPEAGGWSTHSMPNSAQHYIYGNGVWLGLSPNSVTYSYSTNGGSTWSTGTLPLYCNQISPIAFGNGKFVLTGASQVSSTNQIAYSTDGINWTTVTVGSPENSASNRSISGVAFGNGRFVVGWNSTVSTTDTRSPNTFVSVDGINWIPGSRAYSTTSTNTQQRYFPIFDGTGFNFQGDTGSPGWRTIDGINTIQFGGYNTAWTDQNGIGTRGNFMTSGGTRLSNIKFNSTFAIYKLDPSYTTY